MEIIEMPVSSLILYENNPRKNDGAVEAVANSIKEFGFKVPIIIDKNNVIVAGHTRLKAAEKLGLESVPVIRADDLTDEQIRAFRLADNKTAEIAFWDFAELEKELEKLNDIDMSQFGFAELQTMEYPAELDADDDYDDEGIAIKLKFKTYADYANRETEIKDAAKTWGAELTVAKA